MRLNTRTLNATTALMTGVSLLVAPGMTFAAPGEAGHKHETAAVGEPAKPTAKTRTVQVVMGDNFYEPETIPVKTGETVHFVIKNTGEFLHEFNIGTSTMHAAHQKEMAMMVEHGMLSTTGVDEKKMNMDHSKMAGMGHSMKHDDPNSVLVEPGQSKELTWKFIKQTTLEFACNMPGHYEAGMVGKVNFQR